MTLTKYFGLATVQFLIAVGAYAESVSMNGLQLECKAAQKIRLGRTDKPGEPAMVPPGGREIIIDPELLKTMPIFVQMHIFHHECGHLSGAGRDELAADHYGLLSLAQKGFDAKQVASEVCAHLGNNPGDGDHPSGPVRCTKLMTTAQCLGSMSGSGESCLTQNKEGSTPRAPASDPGN